MTENLQHLIERIQKEGLDEAKAAAASVTSAAKQDAEKIIEQAHEQAEAIVQKAQTEAAQAEARGQAALKQAARDVLISLGQQVRELFGRLVEDEVNTALQPPALETLLSTVVEAYLAQGGKESRIEFLAGPETQAQLLAIFQARYQDTLKQGIDLKVQPDLPGGFMVRANDEGGYHDFTEDALVGALSVYLQPHLRKLIDAPTEDAQ